METDWTLSMRLDRIAQWNPKLRASERDLIREASTRLTAMQESTSEALPAQGDHGVSSTEGG